MVVEKQQFRCWGRRWVSLCLLRGELWAGGVYLAFDWLVLLMVVDWRKSWVGSSAGGEERLELVAFAVGEENARESHWKGTIGRIPSAWIEAESMLLASKHQDRGLPMMPNGTGEPARSRLTSSSVMRLKGQKISS